jgi:hypothetical protein
MRSALAYKKAFILVFRDMKNHRLLYIVTFAFFFFFFFFFF